MEAPPSYLRHPPRYVPLSHRPPSPHHHHYPPPPSISDDPNFYLPPPSPHPHPPPPPLPPHSYLLPPPPTPPPPPYTLHYNYIDDYPPHRRYSPPSPRVRVLHDNSHVELGTSSSFRFRDNHAAGDRYVRNYDYPDHGTIYHRLGYYHDSPDGSGLGNYASFLDEKDMWRRAQPSSREVRADPGGIRDFDLISFYENNKYNARAGNNINKKEVFNSPKKNIQKKSALSRIQFSKQQQGRNRNEENRFHSGNSSDVLEPRRGSTSKGSSNRTDGVRERSTAELVVSFKSNSLVAKAKVGSSGRETECNLNSGTGKRKIANLSSSPTTKSSECTPEKKINNGEVSGEGGNNGDPDGKPSFWIKRKKKMKSPLPFFSSREKKKNPEPIKGDRSVKSLIVTPQLDKANVNTVELPASRVNFELIKGEGPVKSVIMIPQPDEPEILLLGDNKVDECLSAAASARDGVRNAKRKRNCSPHRPSAARLLRAKVDEVEVMENTSPENRVVASPEAKLTLGSNIDTNLLISKEIKVDEDRTNLYDSSSDGHINSASGEGQDEVTIFDCSGFDSITKSSKPILLSETNFLECGNDLTKSHLAMPAYGIGVLGNSCSESNLDERTVLLENLPAEEPLKYPVFGGDYDHVDSRDHCLSDDIEEGEIVSSSPDTVIMDSPVDKTSTYSMKDRPWTEEHIVVPDSIKYFSCSLPCNEKDRILRSGITLDSCDSGLSSKGTVSSNETCPKCRKLGKAFTSVSSSLMLPEEEDTTSASAFTFSGELPANTDVEWAQLEDRNIASKFETISGASFDARGLTDGLSDDSLEFDGYRSLSVAQDVLNSVFHESNFDCPEERGALKEIDASQTVEEEGMLSTESFQHMLSLETCDIGTHKMQSVSGMEIDYCLLGNDSFCPLSTANPGNNVLPTKLCDRRVESKCEPGRVSDTGSPDTQSFLTGSQIFDAKMEVGQLSKGKDLKDFNQDQKPSVEVRPLHSVVPSSHNTITNANSGHTTGSINPLNLKFTLQSLKDTNRNMNSIEAGIKTRTNLLPAAVPRGFPVNPSLKKTAPTSHISKSRTWNRTSSPSTSLVSAKHPFPNSVFLRGQSSTLAGNVPSTAYVRSGNSLVRKTPAATATPTASYAGFGEIKTMPERESKVKSSSLQTSLRTELNAAIERPSTPPLRCSAKISNCPNLSSGSGTSSRLVDPPQNVCSETKLDSLKLVDNMDSLKPPEGVSEVSASPEFPAAQTDIPEIQCLNGGNLVSTNMRKLVYVKSKENQLVAASSSGDLSTQKADKIEAISSDGYYKKRKHQLVRKSLETGQKVAIPDETLNSESKIGSQIMESNSIRRLSGKELRKTYKASRFSLVWKLHDAKSLKKENSVLNQVWQPLFPWKRSTYGRSFLRNQASAADNGSLSSISRKLLLSRRRKTIYERSSYGLSLRISKVLSVDGASLKWSKSIEKNSRKASEEATLAVAAVQRTKKEKNGATDVTARTKSRNHSFRERIFRVGSMRYKMDPTRRTLQRISDEGSACSLASQSGETVKRSSVPKRLLIGNHEYVRIGNGNQLIRDPKKRTRILANEKIRWSLRTARMCLARKKKYCQFFTRFGKCNKNDGKCPYIHDPEKIAVCTKFLMGSCNDSNCKLTHKVIPERMEDCAYFLLGLCTNGACPYRHVNVNPNAPICEGFLKGYCADGDECRKKHSRVCPIFESTGTCPQGSKCKLHHPKHRIKDKRMQPSLEQKNTRGRYFDSEHTCVLNSQRAVFNKHISEDDDNIFFREGNCADFIPLDVSDDEEIGIPFDSTFEQINLGDGHPAVIDIDELIKPVCIMKRNMTKESSPAADCPSEKTIREASR